MRTQTDYNKIVDYNKETGEITVLDYIFDDGNFKGATGTKFQLVSKEDFYETIEPYLDDKEELLCYMADNFGSLTSEMIRYADPSEERLKELFFDLSYSEMWDDLRTELSLNEEEAYIFNCSGSGRCFDKNFQGNMNPELSLLIRAIES